MAKLKFVQNGPGYVEINGSLQEFGKDESRDIPDKLAQEIESNLAAWQERGWQLIQAPTE